MHKLVQKTAQIFFACALIALVGCSTPVYTKTSTVDSAGVTNWQYDISPQLSNTLSKIEGGIKAVPETGIAQVDLGKDAALGLLGLATGVLGLIAKLKTNAANQHQQAADALAGTIVKNNLSVQALQNAPPNVAGTVATHIDNNTNV